MTCPHYSFLLDHQLLSTRLSPVEQPHVDKLNTSSRASLPVDNVIVRHRVALQVEVYLLPSHVELHFLQVVLKLMGAGGEIYNRTNKSNGLYLLLIQQMLHRHTCQGCIFLL